MAERGQERAEQSHFLRMFRRGRNRSAASLSGGGFALVASIQATTLAVVLHDTGADVSLWGLVASVGVAAGLGAGAGGLLAVQQGGRFRGVFLFGAVALAVTILQGVSALAGLEAQPTALGHALGGAFLISASLFVLCMIAGSTLGMSLELEAFDD